MPSSNILIEICSNCKSHQWCTRHNEQTYENIAQQVQKAIRDKIQNATVLIAKVGGEKIGSFEIYCNDVEIFSKRALGYFPNSEAVTMRIAEFLSGKLDIRTKSPIKRHQDNKEFNSPAKKPVKLPPSKQSSEVKARKIQTPKVMKHELKVEVKKQVKHVIVKQEVKKEHKEIQKKPQQSAKKVQKQAKVHKEQAKKPITQPTKESKPEVKAQQKVLNMPQQVKKEHTPSLVQQKQSAKSIQEQHPISTIVSEVKQTPVQQSSQIQNYSENFETSKVEPEFVKKQQSEKVIQNQQQKIQNLSHVEQKQADDVTQSKVIEVKQQSSKIVVQQSKEQQNYQQDNQFEESKNLKSQSKVIQQPAKEEVQNITEEEPPKKPQESHQTVQQTKEQQKPKPQEVKQEPKKQLTPEPQQHQKKQAHENTVQQKRKSRVEVTIQDGGKKQSTTIQYNDFQKQVNRLFQKMDIDKDKMIEPHEFKQVSEWFLKQLDLDIPQESKEFFQKYFMQMADTNNDGKLSYEEFKKICWECLGQNDGEEEN